MKHEILDHPLIYFSKGQSGRFRKREVCSDAWTIRDACQGTAIFGAIGSGKTSGSGRALARAFLSNHLGGLVLTAKRDEAETWQRYCEETGRSDSLIQVSARGSKYPYRFNFLDYEMHRADDGGGRTENLVDLFATVLEIDDDNRTEEPFWRNSLRELVRNAVDLLRLADQPISIDALNEVIRSGPLSKAEVEESAFLHESYCAQCIGDAFERAQNANDKHDLRRTTRYWTEEYPTIPEKTRGCILAMFRSLTSGFSRSDFHQLFCTDTTFTPEDTFRGRIILLDLPTLAYQKTGTIAQAVFKYVWQKAVARRDVSQNPRPVFLWVDEAQQFVNSYDAAYQAIARSHLGCTVFLTQNLPSYYATMNGRSSKDQADQLLGNFSTLVFHQNSCPITNEWAASRIARTWQKRWSFTAGPGGASATRSSSSEFQVDPYEFTVLRKGGPQSGFEVDAVLFQGGRTWDRTGKTFLPATFSQRD
ncbi:MAG: hypothetical protein AAF430_01350 [Myxococcota bacterium]